MEFLFVLLSIVLIVLLVSIKNSLKLRLLAVETELRLLRETMTVIPVEDKAREVPPEAQTPATPAAVPITPIPLEPVPAKQPWTSGFTEIKETTLSGDLAELLHGATHASKAADTPLEEKTTRPPSFSREAQPPLVAATARPSFLERNPDLEKFIGENLISKIGIGILVLAIAFFVKYAIDNDWIGPAGRVGIGIGFGGILIWVAHRLRNNYKAFSSVLVGGGLAIFYFTIALAFHQFHLFSQLISFVIMVVITGFAVILSQLYNRQELAIIALIGGFATPFMVSEGSGNYKILFTYLIILNAGLLIIAYHKAWRILNALAFLFTVILFGSWLFSLKGVAAPAVYGNGFLFATVFFLLFFIINIAHNVRENKTFIASDFGILLSNTCLYFAGGLYCLTAMNAGEYRGLFTALMAVFNLTASFILFRNRKTDTNILYLLIGITLSFISLTAPIQLNGASITLFWASECVLLYWLYQKSNIAIIRLGSLLVWTAMLVSLLMDWSDVYAASTVDIPVIFNKGFITSLFGALASYLLFYLRRKDQNHLSVSGSMYPTRQVFRVAGILLLYTAGALEIGFQFSHHYPGTNLQLIYLLAYTFAFVLVSSLITEKYAPLPAPRLVHIGVMVLCVVLYLVTIGGVFSLQRAKLQQNGLGYQFTVHWIGSLLLAFIIYRLILFVRASRSATQKSSRLLSWLFCIVVIIYLSAEIHLLINALFYSTNNPLHDIQRVYVKTGLPILWGLCSFGFMWLGMRHSFRTLRIISLTLFSVILLKLFLFDIRNIPIAGKIAAFFCLGILLLVVSFMYQKLKKIIVDEKKPAA